MHAFTTALPEYHAIAGISPAANTALVVCGYHPVENWYYGMVAGVPTARATVPDLREQGMSLNELIRWFDRLRIGLPGGLARQLRRDGYAGQAGYASAWQQYYWGEQGPELRGLVDPAQDRTACFVPFFFTRAAPAKG